MHGINLQIVCSHFDIFGIEASLPLKSGLINHSYKIKTNDDSFYFLQRINTTIFDNPQALQNNYVLVQQHLSSAGNMQLPKLIKTVSGDLFYNKEGEIWRCFEFLKNTYSPQTIETPEKAYEVANCFGSFTAVLQSFDNNKLATILPYFHDLSLRFQQFKEALQTASEQKKEEVKERIQEIEKYAFLVKWFSAIGKDKLHFPLHILHHDCKIANILFERDTDAIRCPIDLDTTQPGLFFSDIGDMLRTTVPNLQEDDTNLDALAIRPAFFDAINEGYLDAMARFLTGEEKENLHYAGSVLIYMQALRFLTDYLNGNVYYKTSYPEQNKDRAANQLRLLHLLHQFIATNKRNFVR
ncbi:MAG: aminoglycoside phosphotransferase family protein [Bacteroidota bacterium]|nr:aminoglycoside phosphotransferase family protein [Bacteroidota bacterium]